MLRTNETRLVQPTPEPVPRVYVFKHALVAPQAETVALGTTIATSNLILEHKPIQYDRELVSVANARTHQAKRDLPLKVNIENSSPHQRTLPKGPILALAILAPEASYPVSFSDDDPDFDTIDLLDSYASRVPTPSTPQGPMDSVTPTYVPNAAEEPYCRPDVPLDHLWTPQQEEVHALLAPFR